MGKSKVTTEEIEYLSNVLWTDKEMNKYVEEQIETNGILDKIKKCNENYDYQLLNEIVQVGEFKK